MIIGKVVGTVVATISHADYKHRRLLIVQPFTMPGDPADGDLVALDSTHAGIGDTVLVNREGNGARQVLGNPDGCVSTVIVGILDGTSVEPAA
jgi:microcompartment protein CcmK/EutM